MSVLPVPVYVASNPALTENCTPIFQSAKVSCSLSQDDVNLAQPLATSMEYDVNSDVDAHKLEISISPVKNHEHTIVGRRILDLAYICQQIKEKDNHDPYGCSFKDMVCVNEKKNWFKIIFFI